MWQRMAGYDGEREETRYGDCLSGALARAQQPGAHTADCFLVADARPIGGDERSDSLAAG